MSLESELKKNKEDYQSRINEAKEFEDPDNLPQVIVGEERRLFRKQKKLVNSHFETYPKQKAYAIYGIERHSCENRVIDSLNFYFAKRDKGGNLKIDKNGDVKYKLRYRTKPEFPKIFEEMKNTFGELQVSNKWLNNREKIGASILGIFYAATGIWPYLLWGDVPIIIPAVTSVGGVASNLAAFSDYRVKAFNPTQCIETAKKTDEFLTKTIRPIYLAQEVNRIYR